MASLACALLVGCAAGPDFKRPTAPQVTGYTAQPLSTTASTPGVAGGEAQQIIPGAGLAGDWWTLFRSQALDDLIAQSVAHNTDLKAAQAALAAARETTLAQRGAYLPNLSAGFSASRQLQSGSIAPTPSTNAFQYSLFTPQVSVSYAPDVFGLNRRTVESLKAQEQAVRYQMIATQITLSANVAAAVIQDGSLRSQVDATRQLIAINTEIVEVLRYQKAKGAAGSLDLAAQESQLAQVSATLPPLLKQLAQQHDLLAVLTGRFPSQVADENFEISSLTLPQDLPLSLPADLVRQRPDVLQAEETLHAASAQVGIATANRLPNIQLTGNAGSTGLAIGQVFASGTGFWALGAAATAPLFDGGTLRHQKRAAEAAYRQAAWQYRGVVLGAVQNVADTLAALDQDAQGLKAAAAATDAAKVTLDISERQWRAGYASYLTLLSAEQAFQQARIALVQAQANRFSDTVALYQALGGGWWNRTDLAETKHDH